MKHSPQPEVERPLSPARQAWLMLVVIAPMAACYPAIKAGLEFAPSLRFGGLRTLLGGLALLVVLVIRRKPLWPEARLARWILPLGLVATMLTFGAMFASPAYTGVTAMGGFGERLNALQGGGVALILGAIAVSILGGWSGTVRRAIPPVTESPTKTLHPDHQRTRIGLQRPVRKGIEP